MLGMGLTEMLILAGIALVVMGPEKFPEVAKVFIRTIRDIRGYWEDAQRELAKEVNPLKKEIKELSRYKPEDYIDSMMKDVDEKKKPEELDPDLNEPGARGYGAKVPDITPSTSDPNNPYGDPTPSAPEPQPYSPSTSEPEVAPANSPGEAGEDDDDDPLDNPPPRLEA